MKKHLIGAVLLVPFLGSALSAQTNYCGRMIVAKIEQTDSGYSAYISPGVNDLPGDKKQDFYQKFHRRFEYILLNKMDYAKAGLHRYLKDTAELNRRFCALLTEDKQVSSYLATLSNEQQEKKETYTIKEMMQVAARFFWLQNRPSEGWIYYTCIGNNGQKESRYERDYSVLEAFCFEAIFSYLEGEKSPRFRIAARKYLDEIAATVPEAKRRDPDIIFAARQSLYRKMEQDAGLQDALLRYYRKYGNTFGFRLSDVKIKL